MLLQVRRVARLMAEVENHDFMREADAPHHVPPWARAEVRTRAGQRFDLGWAGAEVRTRAGQRCNVGKGRGASTGQGRGAVLGRAEVQTRAGQRCDLALLFS